MYVKLAVQVLNSSVSKISLNFGSEDMNETAKYCEMWDNFLDCLNVRNTSEYKRKLKPFLKPYNNIEDERFKWLIEEFQQYFVNWKKEIEERPGDFSKLSKQKCYFLLKRLKVL